MIKVLIAVLSVMVFLGLYTTRWEPVIHGETTSTTVMATAVEVPRATETTTETVVFPSTARTQRTFTYSIASRGQIESDLEEFAAHVQSTYEDRRGWSFNGLVQFTRVTSGGDFTLWLAAPSTLPSFSSSCSVEYSCRVGRDVVINDERWARGSVLDISLDEYRHMVVNHETGHWLGLEHAVCSGAGRRAHLMQQQSKGGRFLGVCMPNAWPLSDELESVAKLKGVARE